jgi:predicted ATPase
VQSGRSEIVLVAGPGGVGKSRLVGELSAMICVTCATDKQTPLFASGKYDQYTR